MPTPGPREDIDARQPPPCVLVGGLGMGFTLRAALDQMPESGRAIVAELVPGVVKWNREHLSHLAGQPLDDPRVEIFAGDVADCIRANTNRHDAILLDVVNGPHTKSTESEGWLYSSSGLKSIHNSLRPAGVLSIWSAGPSRGFTERIRRKGFQVEELQCRGHGGKGGRHRIWVAQRVD